MYYFLSTKSYPRLLTCDVKQQKRLQLGLTTVHSVIVNKAPMYISRNEMYTKKGMQLQLGTQVLYKCKATGTHQSMSLAQLSYLGLQIE